MSNDGRSQEYEIKRISEGQKCHFYGYYGICPFSRDGRYHLALETHFHDHAPTTTDLAKVGFLDSHGSFRAVSETSAFNFQQGSMLHWIYAGKEEELTWNAWKDDQLVSYATTATGAQVRLFDKPIAAVSPGGAVALGLSYDRMSICRKVVGYENNKSFTDCVPKDDGLFRIDLRTEKSELILSIAELMSRANVDNDGGMVWFNHCIFNPSGQRIAFLCRIRLKERSKRTGRMIDTSMWTVNPDGSDLSCQIPFGNNTSHFYWISEAEILASSTAISQNIKFLSFADKSGQFAPYGNGLFPEDGHACISPDLKWIVCDTYPEGANRVIRLVLYNVERETMHSLGEYHSPLPYTDEIRCDLHPRWSRNSQSITIDSIHEGDRQIYQITISA